MQYVNLTPHRVTVTPGGIGTTATIDVEPSGVVARIETKVVHTDELGHEHVSYGRIVGLPDGVPTDEEIDDYDVTEVIEVPSGNEADTVALAQKIAAERGINAR